MANGGLALVVLTFDDENAAREAANALHSIEKAGRLNIEDTAVIRRDMDGKIHVDNQVSGAVKGGAAIGGVLGLIIGGILFPIGGLILGAAGGAAVGKMMDTGVDKKFVQDVSDSLQPGGSALFVTSTGGDPAAVVAALQPFKGTVYHTNLSSEAEQSLRSALAR
ncbi:MAG: Membrane protein of uknown function [Thermomicrobiales bacterium]|jgi:uncharacterized membrane protein|nr:Membrane protein of uknown function [Thermomicrobiales bacterium]